MHGGWCAEAERDARCECERRGLDECGAVSGGGAEGGPGPEREPGCHVGRDDRRAEREWRGAVGDGAFSSPIPQLLVSSTGSIVKANKSAINEFGYDVQNSEISKLLNLDVKKLSSGTTRVELNLNNATRVYSLASRSVNERLMHVSVQNVTELERFKKILELISESAYVGVM